MATNEESKLFDLASAAESCVSAYEDVMNLMQLLAEELSETMEGLNANTSYMMSVMRDRVPLYCSMLSAIREQTATSTKNLHDIVNGLYSHNTKIKEGGGNHEARQTTMQAPILDQITQRLNDADMEALSLFLIFIDTYLRKKQTAENQQEGAKK